MMFQEPQTAAAPLDYLQWLLCPALFVLACWLLLLAPQAVLPYLPKPTSRFLLGGPLTAVKPHLTKLIPQDLHSAWLLGRLAGLLHGGPTAETEKDLIQEAAKILKVPPSELLKEQIEGLGSQIEQLVEGRGALSHVLGVFKLVNVLWALAIVGIAVSVLPALAVLVGPFVQFLVKHLLVPALNLLLRCLNNLKPVFEVLAYSICLYVIGAAERYPEGTGPWIALTGCMLSIPAYVYSTKLHLADKVSATNPWSAINAFITIVMVPIAVKHDSSLIGFLATAAFFGALGFIVVPFGLGWLVGFKSDDIMWRCGGSSLIILVVLMLLKAARIEQAFIRPFGLGLATFGSITFFLAGLIISSRFYAKSSQYLTTNAVFGGLLLAGSAAGAFLRLDPIFNTSITFLVLWLTEKALEITVEKFVWPAILASSIGLWQLALFLHNNPEWVVSLFAISDMEAYSCKTTC